MRASKIEKRLIEQYEAALAGEMDKRIKTMEKLRAVCRALHFVRMSMGECDICECEGNPTKHVCNCKGFKAHGICSHVLAINHILTKFNVRLELAQMGKRKCKTGNLKRLEKALERMPAAELDSSDEEMAEQLELGKQGK